MTAYMIRHKTTKMWMRNKNKSRKGMLLWTSEQKDGAIWLNRRGPVQSLRANKVNKIAEIVHFTLTEEE